MAWRPVFESVFHTLREALSQSECPAEMAVYPDQGWHDGMQPYWVMLALRGVTQSMNRAGEVWGNWAKEI